MQPQLKFYKTFKKCLDFLDPSFMAKVSQGKIVCLSIGKRIDTENVIAITHSGFLILSLTKDLYEKCGLLGKPSAFSKKHSATKYCIKFNLKDTEFAPGNKLYERAKWSFSTIFTDEFEFLILDSSADSDITLEEVAVQFTQATLENIHLPQLEQSVFETEDEKYHLKEILEWIGLAEHNSKRYDEFFL
jgi:ribonuclease P/MRP protein subunit RPP40